jgi:hypothetical protein
VENFIVIISHLTDGQLEFFGWIFVYKDHEYSLYWNPRYNETQPVSNVAPRYLMVDDWNDAVQMGFGSGTDDPIIRGPRRGSK